MPLRSRLRGALNQLASKTGWNLIRKSPPLLWTLKDAELSVTLDMVLSHYRVLHPNPYLIEVGAFDGVTDDPIYPLVERHALRGILLEPQKQAFEKLRSNYSRFGDRFMLVNAAVGPADGKCPFYRIREDASGPYWLPQLAGLDPNFGARDKCLPDVQSLVVTEEVRCLTFSTLLQEAGQQYVDLLQVDAEGYDAEILRLFDLRYRRPAIVRFEHRHFGRQQREAWVRELIGLGYKLAVSPNDMLAYRPESDTRSCAGVSTVDADVVPSC